MKYRVLGNTGIKVSRICYGALTIGPLQANMSIKEGAALIRYALECGINFIDTAKIYETYPYIKKALKGWDKPVVIVSKSYDYTREGMKKSLEEARLALDRDCIEIFMLHEQESELTLEGHKDALDYLWEAKAKGLVKAVGISTHTLRAVKAATGRDDVEVIHAIVNYRGLGVLDGTEEEMTQALKVAWEKGNGIYGMKPLGGGNLIKNVPTALEYAFRHPYLHSVAIGCKMKEELDYNIAMLEEQDVPAEVMDKVSTAPRKLHIEDWCIGCGACVKQCPFGLLAIKDGKACLTEDSCMFCGYCGAVCPEFAIKVV